MRSLPEIPKRFLLSFFLVQVALGSLVAPLLEAAADTLREGDYAVYLGFLPQFLKKRGEVVYTSASLNYTAIKVGPWLVEWCVVKDYGSIDIVYVHVFYRIAKDIRPYNGSEDADAVVMYSPTSWDRWHEVIDLEDEFLVVLNETRMAIVASDFEPIASWVYLLNQNSVASMTVYGKSRTGGKYINISYEYFLAGYYNSSKPVLAKMYDNVYVAIMPRGVVVGPLSLLNIIWGPRVRDLKNNETGIDMSPTIRSIVESFAAKATDPKMIIPLMYAKYDLASGVALIYDFLAEPMIHLSTGFNTTLSLVDPEPVHADGGLMNKTIRRLLIEEYGYTAFALSQGLMYLYASSLKDLDSIVARKLPLPKLYREFIDYGLSKSIILSKGCSAETVNETTRFIGGWTWNSVREYFESRVETVTTNTGPIVPRSQEDDSTLFFANVLVVSLVFSAISLWVLLREKRQEQY